MAASVHAHFYVVSTESLVLVYLSLPNLVFITGNPGVSQANPDPTREDPYPWATGRGFAGRGQGFSQFLQVQITYFYIFKSYSPALLVISLPSSPLLFIRVITLSRYIILSW